MTSGQNGKESLRLTRKEQQLLSLLEGSPGRCFSRPFLLKTVWGYSDKTKTRTVDVHVSRLRKKLQGRRNVAIHTVVRQGYVLEQNAESDGPRLANGFSNPDAKIAVTNGKSYAARV
ncbi:MAG: helix-turn-helix domain-containing protein [Bryobacterales bacterium]